MQQRRDRTLRQVAQQAFVDSSARHRIADDHVARIQALELPDPMDVKRSLAAAFEGR
jgi:hypothetical protein